MTLNQHAKICYEDSQKWFGDQKSVNFVQHHALALAGEVGEFCNIIKKIDRGSRTLGEARDELSWELIDVLVYAFNLGALLQIDLDDVFAQVRANNDIRFTKERELREDNGS